jgi:uncharacterized protein (TIGR00255 family)
MLISMTGFGRGESRVGSKTFSIEVKSVNHRYLDMNIRMPKQFLNFEESMRKLIKERVRRGKVDVFVNYETAEGAHGEVKVDLELAKGYYDSLNAIGEHLSITHDVNTLAIGRFPEVIYLETKEDEEKVIEEGIQSALSQALDQLTSMRENEGAKTETDLLDQLKVLEGSLDIIENFAPAQVEQYREKLMERIRELLENQLDVDEERIQAEVVFFADKSNINEEIVRLKSHQEQFKRALRVKEPMGRKLDFIIQEMNREINTIASKSHSTEISNEVVLVKSALEKIREQVQNIE